jgi:hypothetical protein
MRGTLPLIAGLLALIVAPARAEQAEAPRCDAEPAVLPLRLKLKAPSKSHGAAARKLLVARFPCMTFVCSDKTRTMYAIVSERDAKALLGRHLEMRTVPNAGGSAGKDAVFIEIKPKRFVPVELRPHVETLWFNTDPTFWLVDDPGERACGDARASVRVKDRRSGEK